MNIELFNQQIIKVMTAEIMTAEIMKITNTIADTAQLPIDICAKIAHEHCQSISGVNIVPDPVKVKRTSRITSDCRCMARIWGTGSGKDQCPRRRVNGTDYCANHFKKVKAGGEEPLIMMGQYTEHNIHPRRFKGLMLGRIDKPIPVVDEHNIIRLEWDTDEARKMITEKVCSGEWKYAVSRGNRQKGREGQLRLEEWKELRYKHNHIDLTRSIAL